ncbi:helix-turn-helix domain-containing protein [Flavobacterium sp. '19STA2R22 D10 B1']|uniref:helix-turn-helix domain-containing protein n=1 Tax=Flavobacterium aerium TaxID=3037261 RepID=UPI00278BE9F8|nr:helix-turn-helix domain-containing protein [Flavobacterium sp. '19STA2R22 D10 B1']
MNNDYIYRIENKANLNTDTIKEHTIREMVNVLGDSPQSEQLHVYIDQKGTSEIPFAYPFRSNNYSVLLILSGTMKIQLNLVTYTLKPNDLIVTFPKTVLHILEIEEQTQMIAVSFTLEFVHQNSFRRNEINAFDFFTSKFASKLHLNNKELVNIVALSQVLMEKNLNRNPSLFGNEVLSHAFNLLMYEVAALYKKYNAGIKVEMSRKEELMLLFFRILEENFKKERSVHFYANALCVTTGHLTKVLKEISGKTAGHLIDDAVILEARLLLSNPSLTIAQIADELQFSDQSSFGKFFKKHTGYSPSEYRKKEIAL